MIKNWAEIYQLQKPLFRFWTIALRIFLLIRMQFLKSLQKFNFISMKAYDFDQMPIHIGLLHNSCVNIRNGFVPVLHHYWFSYWRQYQEYAPFKFVSRLWLFLPIVKLVLPDALNAVCIRWMHFVIIGNGRLHMCHAWTLPVSGQILLWGLLLWTHADFFCRIIIIQVLQKI